LRWIIRCIRVHKRDGRYAAYERDGNAVAECYGVGTGEFEVIMGVNAMEVFGLDI
jgi:hypothetical protein